MCIGYVSQVLNVGEETVVTVCRFCESGVRWW